MFYVKLAQGQSDVKKSVADKSQDTAVSVNQKSSVFRTEFLIKGQIVNQTRQIN